MRYDLHNDNLRTAQYAKNPQDEQFLLELNRSLQDIMIPGSESNIDPQTLPFIYIVGVPRSGTTLLSQLLCRFLAVGYINNLIARFWLKPSIGIHLSQAILGKDSRKYISFDSEHGVSKEIYGPHEFGYFWSHWFRLDRWLNHHLSDKMLAKLDRRWLKKALEDEILRVFAMPVVFKNVICGFHAKFLTTLHPQTFFVYIKRDLLSTVRSILSVRQARFGSYDSWWSLKPSTYPSDFPKGAVEAVIKQVKDCKREMEEELSDPGVNTLSVSYEEVCQKPSWVLSQICSKMTELGVQIPIVESMEGLKFATSSGPQLPQDLEDRINDSALAIN